MICGHNCFSESIPLEKLNNVKIQDFLDDILFWEGNSFGSNNRRKPGEKKTKDANTTNSHKIIHGHEIDDITKRALQNSYWKIANDPRTGRPYFYHSKTRVTQWEKPAEVKALEKKTRREKKRQDAKFFEEMEENLHRSIGRGELNPGIAIQETRKFAVRNDSEIASQRNHVRTISRMDGSISFEELRDDREASADAPLAIKQATSMAAAPRSDRLVGKPPLPKIPVVPAKNLSIELSPNTTRQDKNKQPNITTLPPPSRVDSAVSLDGEKFIDTQLQHACDTIDLRRDSSVRSQTHARRNTGGTIFLENTMMKPDIHATIKCVCGVYRAHILQGAEQYPTARNQRNETGNNVDVFLDHRIPQPQRKPVQSRKVPALTDVLAFYKEFFLRSKMEHDTIIMSLIYVERVVKATDGQLKPNPENWRSILFACMVLASKVWDDLSMWNVDFSNVSTNTNGLFPFSLRRINELELHLLKSLKFDVRVGASEYAKYYFLIRSMLIRSGLVQESERPLRKTEAFQKLEARTNTYQAHQLDTSEQKDRRSKSMDDNFWRWIATDRVGMGPVFSDSVCLEQIVGSNR